MEKRNLEKYYDKFPEEFRKNLPVEKEKWISFLLKNFSDLKKSPSCDNVDEVFYSFYSFVLIGGFQFSKDEKTKLIQILLPMILMDKYSFDLKIRLINIFHKLHKRYDMFKMEVNWKDFFTPYKKIQFPKKRSLTKMVKPMGYVKSLSSLIRKIKRYFKSTAYIEILYEFKERYCPYLQRNDADNSVAFLETFLPTRTKHLHGNEVEKIIEELFSLMNFTVRSGKSISTEKIFTLLYNISENQMGNINWNKYNDVLFNKILKWIDIFNSNKLNHMQMLQNLMKSMMGSNGGERGRGRSQFKHNSIGSLIIYTLSPVYNTMEYIQTLVKPLTYFAHPSQEMSGKSTKIGFLLVSLCNALSKRLAYERKKNCKIDSKHKINKEMISQLISYILPAAKRLLFNKSPINSIVAAAIIKELAYIEPKQTMIYLMDDLVFLLNSNLQGNKVYQVLHLLSSLIYPLTLYKEKVPNSMLFLEKFMAGSLPAFDVNKGQISLFSCLEFWAGLFASITLHCSDEIVYDNKVPRIVYQLEEFCHVFLGKIFAFFKTQNHIISNEKKKNFQEASRGNVLIEVVFRFFDSLSNKLHEKVTKKLLDFLRVNQLPDISGVLGRIIKIASLRGEPGKALKPFVDFIHKKLIHKGKLRNMNEKEIANYCTLLKGLIKEHPGVMSNLNQIKEILRCLWDNTKKDVVKAISAIIKALLMSIGSFYMVKVNIEKESKKMSGKEVLDQWGKLYKSEDVKVKWHVPSVNELEELENIYNEFMKMPYEDLKTCKITESEKIYAALFKVKSILEGVYLNQMDISNDIIPDLCPKRFEGIPIITGRYLLKKKMNISKLKVAEIIVELSTKISTSAKDITFQELLLETINIFFTKQEVPFGNATMRSEVKKRLFSKLIPKGMYPKFFHRYYMKPMCYGRRGFVDKKYCKIHEKLMRAIMTFCVSPFAKVRVASQISFIKITKLLCGKNLKLFLLKLFKDLQKENVKNEEINGIIHLVNDIFIRAKIIHDFDLLKEYFSMVVIMDPKKETVQKRVDSMMKLMNTYMEHNLTWLCNNNINQLISILFNVLKNMKRKNYWKAEYKCIRQILLLMRSNNDIDIQKNVVKYLLQKCCSMNIFVNDTSFKVLCIYFEKIKPKSYKKKISLTHEKFISSLKKIPSNKSEWQNMIISDKLYFGWDPSIFKNGQKEFEFYDNSKTPKMSNEALEMIKHIKDVVLSEKWCQSIVKVLQPKPKMKVIICEFFKGLYQLFKVDFLNVMKKVLESLVNENIGTGKEKEDILVTLTIIAGLIRSMKHWDYDDMQIGINHCTKIIDVIVEKASYPTVMFDFTNFLNYAFGNHDSRRSIWFVNYLKSSVNFTSTNPFKQAKILQYLIVLFLSSSWRDCSIGDIKDEYLAHVSHDDPKIRLSISTFLSCYCQIKWKSNRSKEGRLISSGVDDGNKEIIKLMDMIIMKYFDTLKNAEKKKEILNVSEVVGKWILYITTSYTAASYMKNFIPVAISLCNSKETELQSIGKEILQQIGSVSYPKYVINDIVNVLSTSIFSIETFSLRLEGLKCFYKFIIRHIFYFSKNEDIIMNTLANFFEDESIEIRKFAVKCLSEYLLNSKGVNEFAKRVIKEGIKQKKKLRKKKKDLDLKKVQHVILSLICLTQAFPYDVKDFTPNVVMLLAGFSYYEIDVFIKNVINETFLNFKKTHKDDWEKHKKKFTSEQLDEISSIGSSSYYV